MVTLMRTPPTRGRRLSGNFTAARAGNVGGAELDAGERQDRAKRHMATPCKGDRSRQGDQASSDHDVTLDRK